MTSIVLSDKILLSQTARCTAVFVEQDVLETQAIKEITNLFPALPDLMAERTFTGKALSTLLVSISDNNKVKHFLLVGLGKKNDSGHIDIETYRRALGKVIRTAEAHKFASVAVQLPHAGLIDGSTKYVAEQTVIALRMALYHFTKYITEKDRKFSVDDIVLLVHNHNESDIKAGIKDGNIIAEGVMLARHCVDLPPTELTPVELAGVAKKVAKDHGLDYKVFAEKELIQMGMGGITGVSRGSDSDCQLVILQYNCGKKDAPTLAFVGKGITFDSGGLSLKPAQYMETMKEDMSGAAAVIGAMQAIAQLKPDVNVIGITPLAENLPSGKATKPGDILTFYNGKTAEVKNTDAEGRLVLADALSYAVKQYKPDAMVDLATLTGACAYALGPFFSGLMSNSENVVENIERAAKLSGDAVWRLPFTDDYKAAIKSPMADIQNIGSKRYMAGAITAGHFLGNFVGDVPWAHLDIAGTAYNVPDLPYYRPETATGVGVRLLVELAKNWKQ